MWCDKHLAAFNELGDDEVRNARKVIAMTMVFQAMLQNHEFETACLGNTNNMRSQLEAHKPVCCFLGEVVMRKIYKKCGLRVGALRGPS